MKFPIRPSALACAGCLVSSFVPSVAQADITWPEGQLLPSFPTPAATQDLFYLRGGNRTWQAEAAGLGHGTGHADGDGWLCQVGVDEANKHMVYGPYVTAVPLGDNTARFRILIDDNTADDAPQVTIDVRDSTSGVTLASQQITRQQFSNASQYQEFSLPFTYDQPGHALELRVYWHGGASIKVDWVRLDRGPTELPMFASLKGIVNRTEPRLFSYEGDAFAEGPYTWFENLGLDWDEHDDRWTLLEKYKSEVAGIVVYDPAVPATMNLATTIAGQTSAIVASPDDVNRLTSAPFDFAILDDLRGDFGSTVDVYDHLYDELWPSLTHRVIVGLSPRAHQSGAREYAVGIGAAVIWLDPKVPAESTVLDKFLSDMGPGSVYMGWWPEEGAGVERASTHGIATVASDYATNLTMHSGISREVNVKPIPPKPILQNKMYVAFILSDGDNLQYVEHLMAKLWNNPDRGKVPIGWTVSPAMLDAMPGALDYYHQSATENDNLISGPSGWGYAYPNFFPDEASLAEFARVTDDYSLRSGLRVVTVWNHITGGIPHDAGVNFANNAPTVLGLTAQNTGGGLTVYDEKLPGFALSCNYCTGEQAMKDHIATAASGWNGNEPRFILIQAQPWTDVRPTTFMNVANSLSDDYVVVRPDNWFQLLRQANELPIEPAHRVEDGVYRLINEASGKCVTVGEIVGEDPTPIIQSECDDVDTQRFQVSSTSAGYVKLAPLGNESMVIDVSGGVGATDDGARAIVWDYLGNANQEWQPIWKEGDDYYLIARHSDRCFDVPSGTTDDAQLQQWLCNGADAQTFQFADPVWPPPMPEPPVTMDPPTPPVDERPDDTDPMTNAPPGSTPGDQVTPPGPAKPSEEGGCACSTDPGMASGLAHFVGLGWLIGLGTSRRRRRR